MKVYKEKTQNIKTNSLELAQVYCNLCGEEIGKNQFGYLEDYLSINKEWGFHSNYDTKTHEFDICGKCYKNLINNFNIKIDD